MLYAVAMTSGVPAITGCRCSQASSAVTDGSAAAVLDSACFVLLPVER
jgi:hypothetical protein